MYDPALKGRNALVTGATSGVGLAMAKALASGGCNLMLSGPGDLHVVNEQCAQLAKEHHAKICYLAADLSTVKGVEALVTGTLKQLGKIDILINNASHHHPAPLIDHTKEVWDESLALNLSSAFHLIQQVLPKMRGAGWGRIINIAPAQALETSPLKVAFSSAKYGLLGLTKAVSEELNHPDITCNVICPGVSKEIGAGLQRLSTISSPAGTIAAQVDMACDKAMDDQNPLAQLTLFICSDAAKELNGQVVPLAW